jgi:undecaprenyl-diphosphatase
LTYFPAALLGIVQGLTEFLPVSSTAHLLLAERLLGFQDPGGVFTVMIQLGAVLAVVWLYRVKVWNVVTGVATRPGARRFAWALLLAFVPAVVAGALASDYVKTVLYYSPRTMASAFIVGGLVMLAVERWRPQPDVRDVEHLPPARAFGVGVFQTLSLIPGVSRSGSTIVGALLLGLDRAAAAEFSFFLAMPTISAAFVHDAWEVRHLLTLDRAAEIAIGFVMAFVSALVVVKPFLQFVTKAGFGWFAWYRIGLGVLLFAAMAAGWLVQ